MYGTDGTYEKGMVWNLVGKAGLTGSRTRVKRNRPGDKLGRVRLRGEGRWVIRLAHRLAGDYLRASQLRCYLGVFSFFSIRGTLGKLDSLFPFLPQVLFSVFSL